jgi:uncharacterized protein (DUF1800 family)
MQKLSRRKKLIATLALIAACGSIALFAASKPKKAPIAQMDESKRALHALNRLTFGPRPGDVEKVTAMGVDKWIDLQLNPQKIDDSALQARLQNFRTLNMDARSLVQEFPPPQLIKAVADGRRRLPSDPAERAIYQARIDQYKQKQQKKAEAGDNNANSDDAGQNDANMTPEQRQQRSAQQEERMYAELDADALADKSPTDRFNAIVRMSPEDRRTMVQSMGQESRQKLMDGMSPEQREQLQAMANPQSVIINELVQGKLIRAIYSERQLEEVMTDFWFNHFNVYVQKNADRFLTTSYERDAIRPHVLGKFKDILMATATDPAMMVYLDNFQSIGPHSDAALGLNRNGQQRRQNRGFFGRTFGDNPRQQNNKQQNKQKQKRGLNENYARELMELQTLGVDGGYTQADVTEVAKVFTGWTVKQPQQGGNFQFDERLHEPGEKKVLGKKIKEGGMGEGKKVLEMLSSSPATAHFISKKLAIRFVADDPPPSLVDSMATTFLKTDGDIKEVLRTMFHSQEFWAPEAYRAKVKTPLEFVVSAVRVTGTDVQNAQPLAQQLQKMGMPLYAMQPPTGYKMTADVWVNSAALLNRMNFGLALASGKVRGLGVDKESLLGPSTATPPADADSAVAAVSRTLLDGDISKQTHDTILKQLGDPQLNPRGIAMNDNPRLRDADLSVIAGLMLGSPEFQRR